MTSLLDSDVILSESEQWMRLDQEWKPVDLDTEEDHPVLSPVLSSLDLRKSTFDSSFLFKKVRRKVGRQLSKSTASLDYEKFLQDLKEEENKELPLKQFYFISGQIISALSVEEICDKIDDIFRSVEKLCSASSTIRQRKRKLPEVVNCSISGTDLSFDDTVDFEKEKSDFDDVDRYIDEAFAQLNSTIEDLTRQEEKFYSTGTVTLLVEKFSSILSSPGVHRSPKRKRQCCDRFRELAEFWNSKASEC